jgi:PhnB protein
MTTVNIYLTFDGNCLEAFEFYKSVLGGEFGYVGRFSEMPPDPEFNIPESDKNKIMHISLPVSKETILMGSDKFGGHGEELKTGNNFSISLNPDSRQEADRLFNGLSMGGQITMPMADMFWGAYYGMFVDKFGINWMINHELPRQE